jgi:hypothetical protein
MKVGEFQEQNDGSVIFDLEMNQEEQSIFINHAVNDILRKQVSVKPRVLITVEGGVIQDVSCDDGLSIEIVELDFDREETHLINQYDCREDTKMIDKTIKEYDGDRFETNEGDV